MPLPADLLSDLRDAFGAQLLVDEPLSRHSSARIGGPADGFLAARTHDDLARAVQIAWAHGAPLFLLGGGSNILIADAGVRGLVVYNRTAAIRFAGETVTVESGVSTQQLARRCAARGLAGLEWAIGIPGTIGGALYGNAGAHGGDMRGCVWTVDAVTPDGPVTYTCDDLAYEYRSSILKREQRRCVILGAVLALHPGDPAAIHARMAEFTEYRKRTQPPGATIGSMFKNPPSDYAGRLIDAARLKGTRRGGAQISAKHGNFFLNVSDATAGDVMALVDVAREAVRRQFGVDLELEIELVGEW